MMCNTTKSESKNTLLALLAGVGAGIVVGLAIAPKSGAKLRSDIGDTVDEYLGSASQKAGEFRESAANLAQRGLREVRKTTDNAAGKIKDMVSGAGDAANNVVDNGVNKGHDMINHAADAVKAGTRG